MTITYLKMTTGPFLSGLLRHSHTMPARPRQQPTILQLASDIMRRRNLLPYALTCFFVIACLFFSYDSQTEGPLGSDPSTVLGDDPSKGSCANSTRLMPLCTECIPGLVPPHCELSTETKALRDKIKKLVKDRYPNSHSPTNLYPYLNTDEMRSRHGMVGRWIAQDKRTKILDIGTNYSPLLEHFPASFCPEILLMVEPVGEQVFDQPRSTPWLSEMRPCQDGGYSHIIIAPVSLSEYLTSEHAKLTKFDAVVCIGCDADWGACKVQ
jgi:hypothetical protein